MQDDRIPKGLLYGELAAGKRVRGRSQLRFKDVFKRDTKALDMGFDGWGDLAQLNRSPRRGGKKLQLASDERRERRKNRPASFTCRHRFQMQPLRHGLPLLHRPVQPQQALFQCQLTLQGAEPWQLVTDGCHWYCYPFVVSCRPGEQPAVSRTDCEPCRRGTYQPLTGQVECIKCPSGTSTKEEGADDKSQCRGQ